MVPLFRRNKSKNTRSSHKSNFQDRELGSVRLLTNNSRDFRLDIKPSGEIVLSIPKNASEIQIANFINQYRSQIKSNLARIVSLSSYNSGDRVGRHHWLVFKDDTINRVKVSGGEIIVYRQPNITASQLHRLLSPVISKVLRQEATRYLPKRLRYFALKYGFKYQKVRIMHAKSRWGSCSTQGTISLNIALMQLTDEQIDYVILHELVHTKHMNHSASFWRDLQEIFPRAYQVRDQLKERTPYV